MANQQIIVCAFCKGTGKNPHFRGTCPVCKGRGKNQVTGKYMACGDCRGSGQKRGTSLTCYNCAGLGVIPDTREELRQARQEIRKVQVEMEEERLELSGRQPKVGRKPACRQAGRDRRKQRVRELVDETMEEDSEIIRDSGLTRYCQSCANEVTKDTLVKICWKCFKKLKKESL